MDLIHYEMLIDFQTLGGLNPKSWTKFYDTHWLISSMVEMLLILIPLPFRFCFLEVGVDIFVRVVGIMRPQQIISTGAPRSFVPRFSHFSEVGNSVTLSICHRETLNSPGRVSWCEFTVGFTAESACMDPQFSPSPLAQAYTFRNTLVQQCFDE